jgi:hypothetical protein
MFMPGFVTRGEQKALRASKAYCELLATPWECLDARERVLRQRPPDLADAATFAAGACKTGSARGCVLWAETLGCGRGVPPDPKKGLSLLRRQCEETPQACLELAVWLDFPGARTALDGSPARANATYVAAEIALTNGLNDRAAELLAALPKTAPPWPERRAFLSAMIALGRNDEPGFRDAVAQLRKLKPDERVTRILVRVAEGAGGRVDAGAHLRLDRGTKAGAEERPVPPPLLRASVHVHPGRAGSDGRRPRLGGRRHHPAGAPFPLPAASPALRGAAGCRARALRRA